MSVVGKPGYKETDVGWIPVEWRASTLGSEVSAIVGGGTPSKDNPEFWDGDIPWASVKDFTGTRLSTTEDFITAAAVKASATNLIPAGTLITPTRMALGKVAFFDCDVAINQDLKAIFPKPELSKNLLFYWFQSNAERIEDLGTGSTVKGIRLEVLKELGVALPPLPEQQKIAAILTAVDDKLDVIARQIEATQTLKRGLMQTLFSRGVGTQDAEGRWVPHAEFKDSEDWGDIPECWSMSTVDEVCDVKGGKRLPKGESLTEENTGFPYIRVTDMYMGGVHAEGVLYVPAHVQPSIARYTISKDDIFISVAGTLGVVGVIPEELDGANLTENADKLTNIKINRDFLYYALCAEAIQGTIRREATANAQPKLALNRIQAFTFPLPPETEQKRIAEILRGVDAKLGSLVDKQTHYQTLKRGLMQKLLSGEWRVKVEEASA